MITETQSWAFDIRDTFFNAVSADPFFAGYTARKNKMLPVQPDLLPFLGVYYVSDERTSDGDANAGCIRFSHTVRIAISVITANNNPDAAETLSDQACLKIEEILFTDLNIMNVFNRKNVEGVTIESIPRGSRRHIYGNAGQDNETPWIELQYDAYAFFRTEWYPRHHRHAQRDRYVDRHQARRHAGRDGAAPANFRGLHLRSNKPPSASRCARSAVAIGARSELKRGRHGHRDNQSCDAGPANARAASANAQAAHAARHSRRAG